MILYLLSWCGGLCVGGAAVIFGFYGGWVGVLQLFVCFFPPLLQPSGSVLGDGGGGRVLGQAFRVTQRPWVLGRSDWEPSLGRRLGPLAGPECQAWV